MGPAGGALGTGQLQMLVWGSLAAVATCFLLSLLIFLCSSCDREKKPRKHSGDHENLMNVPSDKEMLSRSATSLDAPASSEQNGALTNGDVLSEDSAGTCVQPYEEVQSSASDLLDPQDGTGKPKCPQSRELPRIPPDSGVDGDPGLGTEGPYEVLKDSASQENIVEDCLYETVTEIKEAAAAPGRAPSGRAKLAGKGPPSPRAPGTADFAEYASVDRNKKCRQSADAPRVLGTPRDPEDEPPPPVPVKLLDENENLQKDQRKAGGEGTPEGTPEANKRFSSLSYKSREEDPTLTEEEISAMYSSVHKPGPSLHVPGSSCSPGHRGTRRSASSCSDLYASVRDPEKGPCNVIGAPPEPDYEAIQTLSREEGQATPEPGAQPGPLPTESDYESITDVQPCRDVTRL